MIVRIEIFLTRGVLRSLYIVDGGCLRSDGIALGGWETRTTENFKTLRHHWGSVLTIIRTLYAYPGHTLSISAGFEACVVNNGHKYK